METLGIGPHDVCQLPGGNALAVANGGIATGGSKRAKMNIDTMRPNLSFQILDGISLDQIELSSELGLNSIRHFLAHPDGTVAFATQWQGDPYAAPPLLGFVRLGEDPKLANATVPEEMAIRGYAGSDAFSGDGSKNAVSSPKGGHVHLFSAGGRLLGRINRPYVCGLAGLEDGFLASDGMGGLSEISKGQAIQLRQTEYAWDNLIFCLRKPIARI